MAIKEYSRVCGMSLDSVTFYASESITVSRTNASRDTMKLSSDKPKLLLKLLLHNFSLMNVIIMNKDAASGKRFFTRPEENYIRKKLLVSKEELHTSYLCHYN